LTAAFLAGALGLVLLLAGRFVVFTASLLTVSVWCLNTAPFTAVCCTDSSACHSRG
jgi:hypothetical protein